MSFFGLYTKKELEDIKEIYKCIGRAQGILEGQRKSREIHLKEKEKLEKENADLKKRVTVLSELLVREVDKDTARLEKIQERTKKFRVKKKCESAILRNRMKRLAYEQR